MLAQTETKMKLWKLSYTVSYSFDGMDWYHYHETNDTWWSTTPPTKNTAFNFWRTIKNTEHVVITKFCVELVESEK